MACERRRAVEIARIIPGALLLATALLAGACGGDDEDGSRGTGTPLPIASPMPSGTVGLAWYGHSMFLLQSPDGVEILIDPHSGVGRRTETSP